MVWRKWSRIRRVNFLWEITFNKVKLMFSMVKLNDNWYNHSNFCTMIGPSNLFRMSKVSFKINLLMLPKRILSVKDLCVKDDGLSLITFLFLSKIIFCATIFFSVCAFFHEYSHSRFTRHQGKEKSISFNCPVPIPAVPQTIRN